MKGLKIALLAIFCSGQFAQASSEVVVECNGGTEAVKSFSFKETVGDNDSKSPNFMLEGLTVNGVDITSLNPGPLSLEKITFDLTSKQINLDFGKILIAKAMLNDLPLYYVAVQKTDKKGQKILQSAFDNDACTNVLKLKSLKFYDDKLN